MRKSVLTLIMGLATMLVWAQDTPKKEWSLQECVDYALGNNLDVRLSGLGVESSEVNSTESRYSRLPSLNGQSSYGSRFGRSIDPTSNLFVARNIRSFNVAASSSVTLWNGFRQQNDIRRTGTELEAANEDLERVKNDIALNVAALFLQVVLNKEQLATAERQLASTSQQLDRTQKLAAAGSVPQSDVLNLEAQHATNELNLTQQQNAVDLSILQLKQALQLPSSTSFGIVVPEISIESEMMVSETVDEIYDMALQAMPEVEAAKLRVESSEYGVKVARGSLYPSLGVSANVYTNYSSAADGRRFIADGGASTTEPVPIGYVGSSGDLVFQDVDVPSGNLVDGYSVGDQFNDNVSTSVNVGLNIPIFNGFSARSSVQRAQITNERARIDQKQVENQLRQNVETSYNDALAALKTYQSSLKQVQARDEAFRMTQQRYNIGAVNLVEYQIAENELFQAQSDLSGAKYDFIFRKKVLDFYMGKELKL